jgi:hypothetical protein
MWESRTLSGIVTEEAWHQIGSLPARYLAFPAEHGVGIMTESLMAKRGSGEEGGMGAIPTATAG